MYKKNENRRQNIEIAKMLRCKIRKQKCHVISKRTLLHDDKEMKLKS